jgi:hypothetical protein
VRTVTLLVYDPLLQAWPCLPPGLTALDFILRRSARIALPDSDPLSWLAAAHGLGRQPDWPVAPLLARFASLASRHPSWLCADPAHVELGSERTTVVPATALSLSEAESAELVGALDSHFSASGLRVHAFTTTRWLINAPFPARIDSRPLAHMSGEMRAMLAGGPDSARWNGFLTEAQMLLHGHPVNVRRQACGKPTVNSVHLWGGGADPRVRAGYTLIASDDPLTQALASAAGAATAATAGELLDRMQARSDATALIARRPPEDASGSATFLAAIERDWLAPAVAALRERRIDCLELIAPELQGMVSRKVTRAAFWKFWKGLRPHAGNPAKAQGR